MSSYDTLVDAINSLKQQGYTHDFNLEKDRIYCPQLKAYYKPKEFDVVEVYRFEGMSNPDDNTVLYAIRTSNGDQGLLVDAYGAYAGGISDEILKKLKIRHQ